MTTGIVAVGFGVEIAGYYCIIDQMYLQGIINSRAFALDLGSVDSAAGSQHLSVEYLWLINIRIDNIRRNRHDEVYWPFGKASYNSMVRCTRW